MLQPKRPTPTLWVVVGTILLASSLLFFWAMGQQESLRIARAELEEASIQSQTPQLPLEHQSIPVYARSAQEMLKERSLPWSQALTALESTTLDGVALGLFDASTATGTVRIEVFATDNERVLAYVEALNEVVAVDGGSILWRLQSTQQDPRTLGVMAVLVVRP